MSSIEAHRKRYAERITAKLGAHRETLRAAFANVPRERFLGQGPWKVFANGDLIVTPGDDPALLYDDVVIALNESGVNNGQPALHAACLAALDLVRGETAVQVGAGTGYYTAILAEMVGSSGRVIAFEIDPALASRASGNLAPWPNIALEGRSGAEEPLPCCDVLYVNAGATEPLPAWLDALKPGGRLLFPLTPERGYGGMLLVRRTDAGYAAHFICGAKFIPCIGARDPNTARRLESVFARQKLELVRSLHLGSPPDESCWFAGRGWWLSIRRVA